MKLLEKIFGSKNQKIIKKIQPLVDKINALEESFSQLNDLDLKLKRSLFIKRYKDGEFWMIYFLRHSQRLEK